jgi:hypothetical protein
MRDLPRGTQVVDREVDCFAYGAITLYGLPFLDRFDSQTTL